MNRYCVIGSPVKHSLSPQMMSSAFQSLGVEAKFDDAIEMPPEELAEFMDSFRGNYAGCNVTIPHKESVMAFLDEIDEKAKKIGAVNTVLNDNGILRGYNTDLYGAMRALRDGMGIEVVEGEGELGNWLEEKRVCILGAGGAARALVYGVSDVGASEVTILNRTGEKAQELAEEFAAGYGELSDFDPANFDIVINTTPVGMWPDVQYVPAEITQKVPYVMDIVYFPQKTAFLKMAEKEGCEIITGDRMFLYQGAQAFEIWTGQKAPIDVMEEVVKQALIERDR